MKITLNNFLDCYKRLNVAKISEENSGTIGICKTVIVPYAKANYAYGYDNGEFHVENMKEEAVDEMVKHTIENLNMLIEMDKSLVLPLKNEVRQKADVDTKKATKERITKKNEIVKEPKPKVSQKQKKTPTPRKKKECDCEEEKKAKTTKPSAPVSEPKKTKEKKGNNIATKTPTEKAPTVKTKKTVAPKPLPVGNVASQGEEIKIFKTIVNINNKTVSIEKLQSIAYQINTKILKRSVRKASPYASEIEAINEALETIINMMTQKGKKTHLFEIDEATLEKTKSIIAGKIEYRSSYYCQKIYAISKNNTDKQHKQAQSLLNSINNTLRRKGIQKNEPYYDLFISLLAKLKGFVEKGTIIYIERATLSGLI